MPIFIREVDKPKQRIGISLNQSIMRESNMRKFIASLLVVVSVSSVSFADITYPIVSKKLKPTTDHIKLVESNKPEDPKYLKSTAVMIVIGDDPISLQWLKDSKSLLPKAKNAYYLIVNVKDQVGVDKLTKLLPKNANVVPISADWLATELYQLNTYPSLWVLNLKDKNDAASFKKIKVAQQQSSK